MKVCYDPEADALTVLLSDAAVAESDQDKPGVILDYDAFGNMVSFEILGASKRMANPMSVEFSVITQFAGRHDRRLFSRAIARGFLIPR